MVYKGIDKFAFENERHQNSSPTFVASLGPGNLPQLLSYNTSGINGIALHAQGSKSESKLLRTPRWGSCLFKC